MTRYREETRNPDRDPNEKPKRELPKPGEYRWKEIDRKPGQRPVWRR